MLRYIFIIVHRIFDNSFAKKFIHFENVDFNENFYVYKV